VATAHDVITRALRTIGALAAGETADADDAQDALLVLNQMLAGWEIEGIRMGLPTLALTDQITVPAQHIEGIVMALAVTLAQEYGRQISPGLMTRATRTRQALQMAYASIPDQRADLGYQQYGYRWRGGLLP
jgi:hypothetical protein